MEFEVIERFEKFIKSAKTRGGLSFKCETYQIDREGKLISVKGKVFVKIKSKKEVALEMSWDLDGKALISPVYDLIKESSFK